MTSNTQRLVFRAGVRRATLELTVTRLGGDYLLTITNENAHLGAVAVGEFDPQSQRTSVSLVTRPGHKDDVLAQRAAHMVSKQTRRPSCVVAGVHVDEITASEIKEILALSERMVRAFLEVRSA